MAENGSWWLWRSFWCGFGALIGFFAAVGLYINEANGPASIFLIIGLIGSIAAIIMYKRNETSPP